MLINRLPKTAFVYDDRETSYDELVEQIEKYAAFLPIKEGDRVLLFSENRPEWIYAFYASWGLGGVNVPVDAGIDGEGLRYIISDCRPSVIFCSAGTSPTAVKAAAGAAAKPEIIVFENIVFVKEGKPVSLEPGDADSLAVIVYTSGTTGDPKGVMLTFGNLVSNIEALVRLEMFKVEDRILGLLPFHHILPLQGIVIAAFYIGATVVYVKNLVAESILEACQKHKVTMFLGVPRLYELFHTGIMKKVNASFITRGLFRLARTIGSQKFGRVLFGAVHRRFGGHVHSFLTGGAKMDDTVAKDLWSMGFRLVEGYGLTETSPLLAFNPYGNIKLGSVGLPLSGSEVAIEDGEVVVRGPNVMKGYYNKPVETERALRGGWFHTGDTGYFDGDGYLYLTGRKDEMIVLPNGKNVNPEEIENRILRMSPMIKEIAVMQDRGQLVALILPDLAGFTRDEIASVFETLKWKVIDAYNATAASYKKIFNFTLLKEELPKTRLGKMKRFLFPGLVGDTAKGQPSIEEPDFPEYRILRDRIRDQKNRPVYPQYHLELDCGLDSLDMVEMLAFIEATFGVLLSKEDFAAEFTVMDLAELVRTRKTRVEETGAHWKTILEAGAGLKLSPKRSRMGLPVRLFRPLFTRYFDITHRGLENLPEAPFIIAPNHASYLDAPTLALALPEETIANTFYIAKQKLIISVLMMIFAGRRNIITLTTDRNLRESLQKAAAVLRSGRIVMIFPEGTRSTDGRVGAFRKSVAILGREMGVPIVPVAIRGTYEAMPRGKALPRRGAIEISILPPVAPGERDYDAITDEVRGRVIQALGK